MKSQWLEVWTIAVHAGISGSNHRISRREAGLLMLQLLVTFWKCKMAMEFFNFYFLKSMYKFLLYLILYLSELYFFFY